MSKETDITTDKDFKPNYNITFYKKDKEIGKLYWDDGVMRFKGNVKESAELFFGWVQGMVNEYVVALIENKEG